MDRIERILERLTEPTTWWGTLAVAGVLVVIALLVLRIAYRALRPLVARSPVATAALARTVLPAGWVLPLIALQGAWELAPDRLPGLGGARHATAIGLILAVGWMASAAIAGIGDAIALARPVGGVDDIGNRRLHTQLRVLVRTAHVLVAVVACSLVLVTFPGVRHLGSSLLASAGLAGIVAGLAARPVLGNLIAGLQIGLTQPIRLDDVVIVEGEWGVIEEIGGAYVVLRLWDERRMVVPLQWWIEKPFQNWTRSSTQLLGTVVLWLDYRMPLAPMRGELLRVCEASERWDRRVAVLQVTDSNERAMQVRALVSAADAGRLWELRCEVREALVDFVQRDFPQYLPRLRAEAPPGPRPADPDPGDAG